MKCTGAQQLLDQIDRTIGSIRSLSSVTALEESYLAKFLVVFICGLYEEIIKRIVNEMIAGSTKRNQEICQFIQNYLQSRFRNPDMKNIGTLLKEFNPSWRQLLLASPLNSKVALDSIVKNKNAMAHGQHISLTIADVERYYISSRAVIEKVDDMLLP